MTSKKDAWDREAGTHEIEAKGKKYRNLVLFTRPCETCQERFGIYVSQAVAAGHKSNNNFALKNCEKHRQRSGGAEAVQRVAELEALNRNLTDECNGHLAYIKELEAERAQHKPPTVQEALRAEGVTTPMQPVARDIAAALYGVNASPERKKLPWS